MFLFSGPILSTTNVILIAKFVVRYIISLKAKYYFQILYYHWWLPLELAVCTLLLQLRLDCCWNMNGRAWPPGSSARRTGSDHHGGFAVQEPLHGAGVTSAGLWCSLSSSHEWVAYVGCWVVCVWSCSLGALSGSAASQEVRPGSADTCVLPGATLHELQSDLQMVATRAGLRGAQARPSSKPSLC